MPILKLRGKAGERYAIRGGNCNNDANCGRYVNLNNTATNTNWYIGAAVNSCLNIDSLMPDSFLATWQKLTR